ncbi:MAG: glutathione S-transferase family protein [Myxococcales bacterium]|nr:glutathione S-transferase family protein [Myxococcales bacterium]MCB9576079.1 glutathione S-transferase family protein [Polyangiaceae bacterium]
MKLYHHPLSPNARRALLVIAHLGLDVEEHVVKLSEGETRKPEFLKLNPNGKVPVLVDGDFVLTESRVIEQYLASKKPESGLWPKEGRDRFDVNRWAMWDASHFSPALGTIAFEKLIKPMVGGGDPNEGKIRDAEASFAQFAKVLDGHLQGRDWLVGDCITVADFTVAASLTYAGPCGVSLDPYPNLKSWMGRISELPAWQATTPKFDG